MMTPTELEQITQAQQLVEERQFRKALGILKPLAEAHPQETKLQNILRVCELETVKYSSPGSGSNSSKSDKILSTYLEQPKQEVVITFKNPGKLAFALFAVIVLAIVVSYLIIILLIGLRFNFY
jgi:hypothetical protein